MSHVCTVALWHLTAHVTCWASQAAMLQLRDWTIVAQLRTKPPTPQCDQEGQWEKPWDALGNVQEGTVTASIKQEHVGDTRAQHKDRAGHAEGARWPGWSARSVTSPSSPARVFWAGSLVLN